MGEENINPEFAGPAFSVDEWRLAYRGVQIVFDPILGSDEINPWVYCVDDRTFQDFHNNLWDNHPGDLDRWADDGGREPQGES